MISSGAGTKSKTNSRRIRNTGIYIRQWKRESILKVKQIKLSNPRTIEEATERISELERQLLIAKEERDILKKAVSLFVKLYKRDKIDKKIFSSRGDAELEIFKYVEIYKNSKRLHSSNNYRTSNEVYNEFINQKI